MKLKSILRYTNRVSAHKICLGTALGHHLPTPLGETVWGGDGSLGSPFTLYILDTR